MTESFVLIKDDYKNVFEHYCSMTGSEADEYDEDEIICDDMQFEECDDWCRITLLYGDTFAEEILLELANGKKLLYFYSDDSQMDCEFLVINNNEILRKKYIYADTPELNADEGHLQCEDENEFEFAGWNDIDYMIEIARNTPDKLFVV